LAHLFRGIGRDSYTPVVPGPVVRVRVVLAWYDGSWCGTRVVHAWYGRPWCGAPVVPRVIVCSVWFSPNARCAGVIACRV